MNRKAISRRSIIQATMAGAMLPAPMIARAQAETVKIGVISPLTGPYAHQGTFLKDGIQMAADDLNAAGGIQALGGRKIELVTQDAGVSVETARDAAQELLASHPDMVAGIGAWLSAMTLAVTEVSERAGLPWVTMSYADSITARGYKYLVQTLPMSSVMAAQAMPTVAVLAKAATGETPKTVAIISDSQADDQTFVNPLRHGGLQSLGIKLVLDEVYSSPISDATALVQRVRLAQPDFVLFLSPLFSDSKLMLATLNEFGLRKPSMPLVTVGTSLATPAMLAAVGPQVLEGLILVTPNWTSKRQESVLPSLVKRSGQPWIEQNILTGYGDMHLVADAINRAGSTDRDKVMQALRATNTATGPAEWYMGDRLAFDTDGRRLGGTIAMVQWQGGQPWTVWPQKDAFRAPVWK